MLSNTTMTRPSVHLLFKVVDVDRSMAMAAEGVFRHETGRTALEAILVAGPANSRWTLSNIFRNNWKFPICQSSWTEFGSLMHIRHGRSYRPTGMFPPRSPTQNGA